MRRPHYKDPLAAAWMLDKFGMQFPIQQFVNTRNNGKNYKLGSLYNHIYASQKRPECYYIHPDSLHLLEPQAGDVAYVREMPGDPLSVPVLYPIHISETKHDIVR